MSGFKKPSVVARNAKVEIRKQFGLSVPADSRRSYTDKMEFLGAGTLIGYKDYPGNTYPTGPMKAAITAGASKARSVIHEANKQIAKVVMLRQKESALFQDVMATHFGLIDGDLAGGDLTENIVNKKFSLSSIGKRDRRWVLEKIREKMLSLSFHLNTGVYLIDIDASRRDIRSGAVSDPANASPNEEAFVSYEKGDTDSNTWRTTNWRGMATGVLSSVKNGQIHISFEKLKDYSELSYARIIIHEAAHRNLGSKDHAYAHEANYAAIPTLDCLNNADSIAWAAISLYCGQLKMSTPADEVTDWANCA